MTYADPDFIPGEGQEEAPSYPSAFGITFTPKISGVAVAVLGLLGAAYLALNVVQPVFQQYQELQGQLKDKQGQLKDSAQIKKQIEQKKVELQQAKQQNKQVLSLFASEKTLDTLILDLNSFVKDRKGTLNSFQPKQDAQKTSDVVTDGSLGPAVNGKLKRKSINVEVEGSFDQIQSILRSFERLQSLLLVKEFKADVSTPQALFINNQGKVMPVVIEKEKVIPGAKPTIKTTFRLDALLPLTEEETKAATAAAQPPAQK
ncbi:MAG TPA: hypothetical protein DDZ80_27680 [Cyanobacteria bacterium UBA8803]|nr:hypothetical protein [Cyanobacteria bacterium UBA9273]HBL62050.1 hypothetical protein [Cyanobacteria bacterium UBA8803]